jgi:hypothetical protein
LLAARFKEAAIILSGSKGKKKMASFRRRIELIDNHQTCCTEAATRTRFVRERVPNAQREPSHRLAKRNGSNSTRVS